MYIAAFSGISYLTLERFRFALSRCGGVHAEALG